MFKGYAINYKPLNKHYLRHYSIVLNCGVENVSNKTGSNFPIMGIFIKKT
jgi:hypothetical protein